MQGHNKQETNKNDRVKKERQKTTQDKGYGQCSRKGNGQTQQPIA